MRWSRISAAVALALPLSTRTATPAVAHPDDRACQFALLAENDIGEDVWILFSESYVNNNAGASFNGTDYFESKSNQRLAPGKKLNARYEVKGRCGAPRQWFMTVRIGPRGGEKILVLRITDAPNERDIYLGQASCWALARSWDDPDTDRVVNNDDEAAGCDPSTTRYGLAPEDDDETAGGGGADEGGIGVDEEESPVTGSGASIDPATLQGNWRRFDSNNPPNDGMRAVVQGERATLTFMPSGGSQRFREGDVLWQDISPDGTLQVLGSNGQYYSARMTLDGDRINIDVEYNGPGNDQTWNRAGPSLDGEWVLRNSGDGANEGMRILVRGDRATLRYLPANASGRYRVGDVLWQGIGREDLQALTPSRDYASSGYRLTAGGRLRVEMDGVVQLWLRPGAELDAGEGGGPDEPGPGGGDANGDSPAACVATSLVDDVMNVDWGWGLTESDPDPGSIRSALPAWEPVPARSRRVIDVDRSVVPGLDDHYSLIWEANTGGLDWEEAHGLTANEFETRNETYRGRGLRLTDVEVDEVGGTLSLAGVWSANVERIDWSWDQVISPDDFDAEVAERRADGYRLVAFDAFRRGSQLLYTAVWHRSCAGADWDYVAGADREAYQARLDAATARGLQPIDFESWMSPEGQRYAAIFEAPAAAREFRLRSGRNLNGFINYHRRYVDQGFRLTDYESYETDSGTRYAGIWVENDDRYRDPIRPVLDTLVQTYQDSTDVPGMSVVVMEDGDVVYSRGFGMADRATQKWAWSGTVYLLASVSKVIGATLATRLEERGVLDLSKPTADYLVPALDYLSEVDSDPTCRFAGGAWVCKSLPDEHTHTVEQLLAKTACVPHYADTLSNGTGIDYTPPERHYRWRAEALAEVWDNGLLPGCTPGQKYHYSTPGYTFVGGVLERQTGRDIATLIQDEIADPLGLSTLRTMFTDSGLRPDFDRAEPYVLAQPAKDSKAPIDTLWVRANPTSNPSGPTEYDENSWKVLGGGIESDAMDLARFGSDVMDGQVVADPNRMWSSRTSGLTYWRDTRNAPAVGLGWELDGQYAYHGGSWVGARSYLRLATNQGISVAVLANRRNLQMVSYRSGGYRVRGIRSLAREIMNVVLSR